MKKILLFIMAIFVSVGIADAAVRDENAISRTSSPQNVSARATSRTTTARTTSNTVSHPTTTARRGTKSNTVRGTTTARTANSATVARSAISANIARSARNTRDTKNTLSTISSARSATRPARAATTTIVETNTFGTGYNTCRDAYFTCMDQFCATANDTYRRCICSSKLAEIQSRERALGQTADQIQDFKDLNIEAINKTASEVTAMLSATAGEYAASVSKDKSDSAVTLAGISEVLSDTKSKSLSTQGTLDIAGDINAIWATSDLVGGSNIANLTGEALYNAVHAQCSDLVNDRCESAATKKMVTSAYGMYIENDCSALISALDKKLNTANGTIRATEREMQTARLENYNAHNSSSINQCISLVRADITADTACGTDYVHCLDVTGLYLNRDTGEPIYTANFYQLETQISLSGDILTNNTNRTIVAELNRKRTFAEKSLDTCRDLADDVWDEFMRQAITEIYQGQHERIRTVKNECLDVVNACYDEQSQSLKDFSNVKDQLLLGSRMELSEQMCQEKLDACSNLYGGGSQGMQELLIAMHDITNQTIAKECKVTLQDYAKELCAVPSNDTLHAYPFGCRVYAPGDQKYAAIHTCNMRTSMNDTTIYISNSGTNNGGTSGSGGYVCPTYKKYTSCKKGYYLADANGNYSATPTIGNQCAACPENCTCDGGTANYHSCTGESGETINSAVDCGDDYIGSLYHKIARYAMQACVRPSEANYALPATVLQDINTVMDQIRVDMATELSDECERLGGEWVSSPWVDKKQNDKCCANNVCHTGDWTEGSDGCHDTTGQYLFKKFYTETSANTKWGFCATPSDDTGTTTETENPTE